jgi:CMP-N-acetylneuraminic acid synthetase
MLALIPARGGSKGLPGKNIRPLAGLPLIAWTIRAAQGARSIDRIVVTTDDPAIAAVAQAHGAEVPCLRPAELAGDDSPAWAAYLHMAEELERRGAAPIAAFAVLQPTSPLRTAADIDAAVELFHARRAQAVISVTATPHPASWLRRIDADGVLRPFLDGPLANANRQQCPPTFLPNGAVFVLDRAFLAAQRSYYGDRTFAYEMPASRSVDIDTAEDFAWAEHRAGAAP